MKWVPLKKFSDHLRGHTDNLVLETKQEVSTPPEERNPLEYSSNSLVTNYSTKTLII